MGIDDISIDSLNAIASEPDDEHVFYADDLQALIDQIVQAVTQGALAGVLYDLEATEPDGTTVHTRVLLTVGGDIKVISWQEL